jgi:hypothetical protein
MKEKKLFRVDINLSYLFLTDDPDYGDKHDVTEWIEKDFHSGELDAETKDDTIGNKFICQEVTDINQVKDYNSGYVCYGDNADETDLENLTIELGLDAKIMIDRLTKLGYTVSPAPKSVKLRKLKK